MPQFFVDQIFEIGEKTQIKGEDAHHILNVLRLDVGDRLIISDGRGRSFRAKIIKAGAKLIDVIIKNELKRRVVSSPTLAFAVIKHDRSEWLIQKATELGCMHMIPFYCKRTIPKYANADKKLKRWRQIAVEAAKQSGLPVMPQIDSPITFDELCGNFSNYEKSILFWEGENKNGLKSQTASLNPHILLIVGPEGGFDESEINLAKKHGAITISLGEQILRVETAAIAALVLIQYELGNLST